MLFQPAIMALTLASAIGVAVLAGAAVFAVRLLRDWDVASGSEGQIVLERRTYLVSTFVALVLVIEIASLVLFVHNADAMAMQFVGAMCAVGTLNANGFGFPALILRLVVFFLAAAWLILDHLDTRGYDYPLIRIKYASLLGIAPVVAAAAVTQLAYFLNLDADVITSCCSRLFTPEPGGVASDLSAFPPGETLIVFFAVMAVMVAGGVVVARTGRGAAAYSVGAAIALVVTIAAIIAVLSVYVYEQPHHHCPFCLLVAGHGFVGYALYGPLFLATAAGIGVGMGALAKNAESLSEARPRAVRRLAGLSVAGYAAVAVVSAAIVVRSNLILPG